MWTKIDSLLTPTLPGSSGNISADDFATFFSQKVNLIRAATASVRRILRTVPPKHCSLDPAPNWLLKKLADDIIPVICHLCNTSLECCRLPGDQKSAVVRPQVKKPTVDAFELYSYRPITNLSFLSKIVERIVMTRHTTHAEQLSLFPARQSAYRHFHSTETVVTSVLNDPIHAADEDKATCLVLLDPSAAFHTGDHDILLDVLRRRFLVDGPALKWFHSYLTGRIQVFCVD